MTKDEALRMAQDLRALADRLNDGWHEGIKIDASDIVLLADAAEALAEQPEQEPEKEVTITCSCGDKFYVPLDELIKQLQEDKRQKFPKRFDTHPAPERKPIPMPPYPPHCLTVGEQNGYAFGWMDCEAAHGITSDSVSEANSPKDEGEPK